MDAIQLVEGLVRHKVRRYVLTMKVDFTTRRVRAAELFARELAALIEAKGAERVTDARLLSQVVRNSRTGRIVVQRKQK